MNFGIIAAGEGSRLINEGILTPKPLVKLNGETLIDRLIRIFIENNAKSISIIINEEMKEVKDHLSSLSLSVPLNLIIKTTPSSLHSFYELSFYLNGDKFCVTTVDTIFKETDFISYVNTFEQDNKQQGLMAVTPFIDDEKPLYVQTNNNLQILSFEDTFKEGLRYVSGGIYGLNPDVFPILEYCIQNKIHRMRNFQREIIKAGLSVNAYIFPKIIDVDHAGDIQTASAFLK